MKGKLRNILTDDVVSVHSTTNSPDSSYGLPCWVDKDGESYGQVQFGAPLGFELIEAAFDWSDPTAAVKDLRKLSGWSTATLAEHCGVSPRTVEGWDQGRPIPEPTLRLLKLLATS